MLAHEPIFISDMAIEDVINLACFGCGKKIMRASVRKRAGEYYISSQYLHINKNAGLKLFRHNTTACKQKVVQRLATFTGWVDVE